MEIWRSFVSAAEGASVAGRATRGAGRPKMMGVPGLSVMARMREDTPVQEEEAGIRKKSLICAGLRIKHQIWLWGNLSAPPEALLFLSALWAGALFLRAEKPRPAV